MDMKSKIWVTVLKMTKCSFQIASHQGPVFMEDTKYEPQFLTVGDPRTHLG